MSEKNLLQPVIAFSNGSEEGAVSCPFCGGEARITYVNDAPFAGCENKSCPAHNFDAIPLAAWNKREPLRKPPAAELCPFCGSIPDRWYVEGEEEYFARCRNPKCEAAMFPGISLGAWNTRPIEDALNARIAELELRLDVYNGNMYDVVVDENAKLEAELTELKERFDITDGLLNQATVSIGAVIACCTYNSNAEAMAGAYGISYRAFTMIDNFIKNYNRAVLDGKASTDVKNIICWPPNPPEVQE